jgi:enterochelin esterase family protein
MKTILTSTVSACAFVIGIYFANTASAESPDRVAHREVPAGKISTGVFADSILFPGTTREYGVYVPAQYREDQPASLMVFMDGPNYAKVDGTYRVPIVFDNLIHQEAMPPTIAVFVAPGKILATKPGAKERSNRSFEYDSLSDRYARFLIDEFLPVALKGLNVSGDRTQRAVCGASSGGICAFTVAWQRPDQFGKVLSHIGSFTDIRGGWAYPGLIRKTKDKPKSIKVYLHDGREDLNNLFGNWPLANEDMALALRFAGYEHKLSMTEGGHSGKWAGDELPEALRWLWAKSNPVDVGVTETSSAAASKSNWKPHRDAEVHDDVPHGTVQDMTPWKSTIFPNTTRDWAIYVPAQYKKESPAALMVFQDGHSYKDVKGRWRVPVVFDNLIARGEMPPTIAIFINPGHDESKGKPPSPYKVTNRSYEYDSLGDRYARFLLEEIIPEVEKRYAIASDPDMRAICGASSGGISSFTVAWERPDQFRKVLSTIGSFTNLRGGNAYPSLIRKTEPKPIRVYLADTSGDLDNPFGNWPQANKLMASSLKYMGYDIHFEWAEGFGHSGDHAGAIFPDAVRWLWRKEKASPAVNTQGDLKGDMTLLNLLIPNENWEAVAEGLGFADAPCADKEGNFYFSDMKASTVYRIGTDGSKREIVNEACSGLEFGPDGRLYGCQGAKSRVIAIDTTTGSITEVAKEVTPNDMAISSDGFIYITETKPQKITRIEIKSGKVDQVDVGINKPNGIALSNDGGTLAVSESGGEFIWTFRVNADGALDAKMPTMTMRRPIDYKGEFKSSEPPPYQTASRGDGMTVDASGRYFVTSELGIQVFDPTGRACGVLPKVDTSENLTSCTFAGRNVDYLYITHGDTIYRRRVRTE